MGSRCRQNIAWWARAIRKIIIMVIMVWGSHQRPASFSLDNNEITPVDFLFLWSLLWFLHSTFTCIHPILFFFQNARMAWIRYFGTSIVFHNVFRMLYHKLLAEISTMPLWFWMHPREWQVLCLHSACWLWFMKILISCVSYLSLL